MQTKSYTRSRRKPSTTEIWQRSCTCQLAGTCATCLRWSQLIAKVAIRKAAMNSMFAGVAR